MGALKPNIVLINCDDLGYGDLGCYGSTANRTPALDRMAAEGCRFTDFYMASPVCSPSRGAMLTGCYPPRIGFDNFDGQWVLFPGQGIGLNPEEQTLATILKRCGYSTAMVGKWHCGDQREFLPTAHGFDSYFGIPYSNDMGRQAGKEDNFPPLPLMDDAEPIEAQPDQRNLIERYTEHSIRFIREHADSPFFLYLAHMQVHLPLYAPDRFVKNSQNGRYGACVEAVDWSTDMILYELKRLGIDENTLVIFTSDNGCRGDNGGSNAPLRGGKGWTWDGGQRLPCIMRWPSQIPAGSVCNGLAASIDFLPTFATLAGADQPEKTIDGVDLTGLLMDPVADSPRESFIYTHQGRIEAVRVGRWKLFVHRRGEDVKELYDLQADIGETTNVYDENPQAVSELMVAIEAAREDLGDAATDTEGQGCRPAGRVENPVTLTRWDDAYPYIEAEYDLSDRG